MNTVDKYCRARESFKLAPANSSTKVGVPSPDFVLAGINLATVEYFACDKK